MDLSPCGASNRGGETNSVTEAAQSGVRVALRRIFPLGWTLELSKEVRLSTTVSRFSP